jgi:ABC-2 type transport system ATP-binding protein
LVTPAALATSDIDTSLKPRDENSSSAAAMIRPLPPPRPLRRAAATSSGLRRTPFGRRRDRSTEGVDRVRRASTLLLTDRSVSPHRFRRPDRTYRTVSQSRRRCAHPRSHTTMDPVITVEHLTKRYKKSVVPAVDDISFDVRAGELFAFLGPNGAGKTTTISILTTTLAKTSGTVTIAGHDLDRDATAVRRSIGIIFQNPSLDLHLSGEENIRLHVALYGLYAYRPFYRAMPAAYRTRIEELAEVVGLRDDIFRPLKTYSGGMKRKLEIIRSLMHRPSVLFLDEPTSGLDPVSRHALWQYLLRARAADGTTIFLTTHYLDEAEVADRVCVIDPGRIAMNGTPDEMKAALVSRTIEVDAEDRSALLAELGRLGLEPAVGVDGTIRVAYDQSTAQSIIGRIATPLTVLRVHDPSLEEAYVELLRTHEATSASKEAAA